MLCLYLLQMTQMLKQIAIQHLCLSSHTELCVIVFKTASGDNLVLQQQQTAPKTVRCSPPDATTAECYTAKGSASLNMGHR